MRRVPFVALWAISVASLLASPHALADSSVHVSIECRNTHPVQQGDKAVANFLLTGTLKGQPEGQWVLEGYKAIYEIRSQGDDEHEVGQLWDFDVAKGELLTHDRGYVPRRYEGHVRFVLPFNVQGHYHFIFPEFQELDHDELVDAVAMFSEIRGAFGTSVPLACRVTAP